MSETPTEKDTGSAVATKVSIGLVVCLAVLAMIVGFSSTSKTAPILLGASTPVRVVVPSISATSTLIPTGVKPDGSLEVPPLATPMQASWYNRSPSPGQQGPSVILGHVNGGGKAGIFAELSKVQSGQEVRVDRSDGQTAIFIVSHVDTIPKASFPSDEVYNNTDNAQLRLITCGGELDRAAHSYLSNVIVYAELVSVQPTRT